MASENDGGKVALGCCLAIAILPFSLLFKAFVLTQLWTWFIAPLGVMQVGLAHAYGISVALSLFTYSGSNTSDDDDGDYVEKILKSIFLAFAVPAVMWGFGYICTLFM